MQSEVVSSSAVEESEQQKGKTMTMFRRRTPKGERSSSSNGSPSPASPSARRRRCSGLDWRAIFAEFLATALFVWAGCGSAVASNRWGANNLDAADLVAIALGFGLTISALAYGFGHISGGHMNPAVTMAFMWLRKISPLTGFMYGFAQFAGAWFGALVLWGCTRSLTYYCDTHRELFSTNVCDVSQAPDGSYGPAFGLGANQLAPRVSNGCGFLIEGVGTYLLVLTVLHSAVHTGSTAGNAAPIAIGWAVLIVHLVLVPFTGCGINPARSFGPLVVNSMGGLNKWTRGWWVFFTAPWVGSGFATLTYQLIFMPAEPAQPGSESEHKKNDDNQVDNNDVETPKKEEWNVKTTPTKDEWNEQSSQNSDPPTPDV